MNLPFAKPDLHEANLWLEMGSPKSFKGRYSKGMKDNLSECLKGQETIAQQAEAIRLKDAAITWIQKRCAGEAMPNWENTPHTGHSRGLILDRTNHALAIQPSPEILQDRDERVAEACANLVNRFISGDGILNDTWVHEIEDAIRSGEWRKYL